MRGRPSKSRIRERISAIINKLGVSYGYEIFKLYKELFGNITSRIVYYNLKRGLELGEFSLINIKRELGAYSWGDETERVYYAVGPYAIIKTDDKKEIEKIKEQPRELNYDWNKEMQRYYNELKEKVRQSNNEIKGKIINKCDKLIEWGRRVLDKPEEYVKKIESIKNFLN